MGIHTTRDGQVRLEVGEIDALVGNVEKQDDDLWHGSCALCEFAAVYGTKNSTVDALEEHFIFTHTTQA